MGTLSGLGLQLFAMLLLMGAIAFALVRLGRRGLTQKQGPLELVARMPLEGRRSVYLLRAGKRVLVVGSSESGLSSLGTLDAAELDERRESSPTLLDLDEAPRGVSAAELLGNVESPVPPRSMWRRGESLDEGDVEGEELGPALPPSRPRFASGSDD